MGHTAVLVFIAINRQEAHTLSLQKQSLESRLSRLEEVKQSMQKKVELMKTAGELQTTFKEDAEA